jgi:hypothetical protein
MKERFFRIIFLCISLTLGIALYGQTPIPIAEIHNNQGTYLNQVVTIQGVITIGADVLVNTRLKAYIQDYSGKGIQIHHPSLNETLRADMVRGNFIRITGRVGIFQNNLQISEFTYSVMDLGYDPYDVAVPLTITQARQHAQWNGTFVKIVGTMTEAPFHVGGGANVNLRDESGATITVRVWDTTGIHYQSLLMDIPITVYGAVDVFNNASQICPGYPSDIVIDLSTPIVSGVSINPPQPLLADDITVSANIIRFGGSITSATLDYKASFESEYTSLEMELISGTLYRATIPSFDTFFEGEGEYHTRIIAIDHEGNQGVYERHIPIVAELSYTRIADIHENLSQYLNTEVTIRGVVTIGAEVLVSSRLKAYIQDSSGKGVQIFRSGSIPADMRANIIRGNELIMTGTIIIFGGAVEITDFTYEVVSSGHDVHVEPYAIPITIAQARQHIIWNGTFVKLAGTLIENPFVQDTGTNINITDNTGQRVTIRVWNTTGIDHSRLRVGVPIEVYGAVDVFNNNTQILPGYPTDIIIKITEPVIENIVVSPEHPFIDQPITVSANIFDYDGDIVSAILNFRAGYETQFSEIPMTMVGDNLYVATLPPYNSLHSGEGEYIIMIEATDNDGNTSILSRKIDVTLRRPVISNVQFLNAPGPGEELYLRSHIIDTDGTIEDARLYYTINFSSARQSVPLTRVSPTSDTFEGRLPGMPAGTTLNISIWAIDDDGLDTLLSTLPNGAPIRYVFPVTTPNATLRILPKAYNIYENDHVEIGYFVKQGDKVIIRIYDSEGKLVATPVNTIVSNVSGISYFTWNGRDKNFRLVQPGLYICHLEAIDRVTGGKKTDQAPIVIGTRLR